MQRPQDTDPRLMQPHPSGDAEQRSTGSPRLLARTSSPAPVKTLVHSTCHHCHHFIDAKEWSFIPDSEHHSSLDCDHCGHKVFGLGRRSTRGSLLSQLTRRFSTSRRHSSLAACASSIQDPSSSPSVSRSSIANDFNSVNFRGVGQAPAITHWSAREVDPIAGTGRQPRDQQQQQPQPQQQEGPIDDSRSELGPLDTTDIVQHDSQTYSTPLQREKRRIKLFRGFVKKLGRLITPDIDVIVIQPSLNPETNASRRTSIPGPAPVRRSYRSPNDSIEADGNARNDPQLDQVERVMNDVDHPISQSATARNSLNENRVHEDSDEDWRMQKQDPERLERIYAERLTKTPAPQLVTCHCRSGTCPCVQANFFRQDSMSTTQEPPLPSLMTDRSSRSNTYPSFSAQSTSTRSNSILSVARDALFNHSGGQFLRRRGTRDSNITNSSRHSMSARPSRINSLATEANSAASRPGSSSARVLVPTGLSLVTRQEDVHQPFEPANRQQGQIDHSSPILEEPPNDPSIQESLRIDTSIASDGSRLVADRENNDPDSHGNSSITITQEGQHQIDMIRGPPEEGANGMSEDA